MPYIKLEAKVINKKGDIGTISSFDKEHIFIQHENRVATFFLNAFELGLLRYEDEELQNELIKSLNNDSNEEEEKDTTEKLNSKKSEKIIEFVKTTIRLNTAQLTFNRVREKDKDLIQKIFTECDLDTNMLFESFNPKMDYRKSTSYSRSKYCVGFLTKYLNNFVFRVFSRNDVYKSRVKTGVTVFESDTTEIFRVLRINNKNYYFSKNLSYSEGYYNNSTSFDSWHISTLGRGIMLNEIIRKCDCQYLNDYISEDKIDFEQYIYLLMPALYDNKVEIVFKNKLFLPAFRIKDISNYLKEFTMKQIDFASKNNVINTLPVIKSFGLYDLDILQKLEDLMKKRRYDGSIYNYLENTFKRLDFDCSNLYKRLIDFLRKIELFEPSVYLDYIQKLSQRHDVTSRDFFDKDYINRHAVLMREKASSYDPNLVKQYNKAVKELLWIDREVDGYFITVPKTIEEYRFESEIQHNCLYARRYYKNVIDKISIIVFLRKQKSVPFVTIEFDYETFDVLQAYGKYNARLERSLYQYIVDLGKKLNYEFLSQ